DIHRYINCIFPSAGKLLSSMKKIIISVRSLLLFIAVVFVFFLWCSVGPRYHVFVNPFQLSEPLLIDLRLIVIVYNRADSVTKCLTALNKAHYFNDKVHIDVWIDRSKNGIIDPLTYKAASKFNFEHGTYKVHNQTTHAGIYGQWINTWQPPKDSKEIAVIIEDDINLSPYFYQYLKAAHKKYRDYQSINGFALQGANMKHGGMPGQLMAPEGNTVFLYPILGTWAFSPKINNWIAFKEWFYRNSPNPEFIPRVPNILPTKWYENGRTEGNINPKMWSMWHIYYAYLHNEVTLYKNSPDKKSFSANRLEKGLHYSGGQKKIDPFITSWKDSYINFPDTPIILDINGNTVPDIPSAWQRQKTSSS
ncbi:uncharacterized protein LOC115218871 isoform X2, partial [Argonauta hians]